MEIGHLVSAIQKFPQENFETIRWEIMTYTNNTNVIIINTKDGYVVFNQEDTKKTNAMFDKLKEKLEESQS